VAVDHDRFGRDADVLRGIVLELMDFSVFEINDARPIDFDFRISGETCAA
jgi:hypothetical protein